MTSSPNTENERGAVNQCRSDATSRTPTISGWVLIYAITAALSVVAIDATAPWLDISIGGHAASAVKIAALIAVAGLAYLDGARRHREAAAAQRSLDESQAVSQQVFDAMDEGVLLADIRAFGLPLTYVNPAFERITGYSAQEAVGKNCRYLQGADRLQPEIPQIRAAIESGREIRVTLRNYRKDGSPFWNDLHLLPVSGRDGKRTHFVGIVRDVTEMKDMKTRLDAVDHLDRLTSVANRYFFYDQLSALLETAGSGVVLVAKLDIARFHEINTSYGYEVGDLLLTQIAERLRMFSSEVAASLDHTGTTGLIGRLAADEFALAVRIADPASAEAVIGRLRAALRPQFILPGASLEVHFAIGFTVASVGCNQTAVIRQVGMALQEAKRSRLGQVQAFTSEIAVNLRNRMHLTSELQLALSNGDFELHFQPKVDLASGAIVGAEALVRWRHPVFGLQSPDLFIPMAEETGLILDLGAWVMRAAAGFAVDLNRDRTQRLTVSVNVSQLQFTHRDMTRFVGEVLDESGADPSTLILELTESVFVDGSAESVGVFRRLREMGLGLSIDDFGTGYSSLRYLESFPMSEVKIDKSFVQGLDQSRVKHVIVDTVIKLAAEVGISVVAEGVETELQRETLRLLGCGYGQGYLFGRPVPADAFRRQVELPGS